MLGNVVAVVHFRIVHAAHTLSGWLYPHTSRNNNSESEQKKLHAKYFRFYNNRTKKKSMTEEHEAETKIVLYTKPAFGCFCLYFLIIPVLDLLWLVRNDETGFIIKASKFLRIRFRYYTSEKNAKLTLSLQKQRSHLASASLNNIEKKTLVFNLLCLHNSSSKFGICKLIRRNQHDHLNMILSSLFGRRKKSISRKIRQIIATLCWINLIDRYWYR